MPIWLEVVYMDYIKLKDEIIKNIPEGCILNRQDLMEFAIAVNNEFKETLFRNLLEKLMEDGELIRIGRNQYRKATAADHREGKVSIIRVSCLGN